MPYIKDLPDIESRWYRDPVTGKSIWTNGKMSYSEWAKAFNIKPLNKKKFIEAKPKVSRLQGPKLTEPEERAINNYVSSDPYKLNSALKSDRPLTENQEKLKRNLDKALEKMPYYTDDKPLQRDYFFMNEAHMASFLTQMDNGWFKDPAYIYLLRKYIMVREPNRFMLLLRKVNRVEI